MGRRKTPAKERFDIKLVREMPPLKHTGFAEEFIPEKSEVFNWICSHYEFAQMIFNDMRNSGYIKYNADTQTWQGVDYIG